jgi:hypothetical protein
MSYRIAESGPDYCKVQLTSHDGNAQGWVLDLPNRAASGTLVKCCVDFSLKLRYVFLAPLLWLSRFAMFTDLELLKRAVESESAVNSIQ